MKQDNQHVFGISNPNFGKLVDVTVEDVKGKIEVCLSFFDGKEVYTLNELTFKSLLGMMRAAERVIEEIHKQKRIEEMKTNLVQHLSFVPDKDSSGTFIVFQNRVEIGTLETGPRDGSSWLDALNNHYDVDFYLGWSEVWELPILYLGKHTEFRINQNEHFEGDLPQLLEDWLSIERERR